MGFYFNDIVSCKNCKFYGSPFVEDNPLTYSKNANCSNEKINDVKVTHEFTKDGLTYYAFGQTSAYIKVGEDWGCKLFQKKKKPKKVK